MLTKLLRIPVVALWMMWQIIISSWAIALAAITPSRIGPPVLLRYPLISDTDLAATVLSWAITVTPGTLVVAIGERELYVHVVLGGERDQLIADFAEMERKLLSVLPDSPGPSPHTPGPTPTRESKKS